jgi:anaerobic selenocysteine-containing dehydrogenase
MARKPTTDELFEMLTRGSRIPLAQVKRHPHGHVFDAPAIFVAPRAPHCTARLDVGNSVMLAELAQIAREGPEQRPGFAYRLISRRLADVYNSSGRDIPRLVRRAAHNPAFMHPQELSRLGVARGDVIEIASSRASILGIAEPDPSVRPGLVSMAHSFGDSPDRDADFRTIGSNTGRLSDVTQDYDPYSGIPRMSAIPVRVRRWQGTGAP